MGGTRLEDVPGVAVEAYVIDHSLQADSDESPDEDRLPSMGLGKLPPGFGARRLEPPAF
jgi:hypothetical protein